MQHANLQLELLIRRMRILFYTRCMAAEIAAMHAPRRRPTGRAGRVGRPVGQPRPAGKKAYEYLSTVRRRFAGPVQGRARDLTSDWPGSLEFNQTLENSRRENFDSHDIRRQYSPV